MTLEAKLEKVAHERPDFDKWLTMYINTGFKTYSLMVENELHEIRKFYGPEVHREFQHIYTAARELKEYDN